MLTNSYEQSKLKIKNNHFYPRSLSLTGTNSYTLKLFMQP